MYGIPSYRNCKVEKNEEIRPSITNTYILSIILNYSKMRKYFKILIKIPRLE